MPKKPYTLVPAPKLPFGEAAKIALCKTRKGVLAAKEDGCHAAIYENANTRAWYKLLLLCRYSGDTEGLAKLIADFLTTGQTSIDEGMTRVDYQNNKGDDCYAHVDNSGDGFESADTVALFVTEPTTHLFWQLPVFKEENPYFERRNGQFKALSDYSYKKASKLPMYIPKPGGITFLFKCLEGQTMGHRVPHYEDMRRARIVIDMEMRP